MIPEGEMILFWYVMIVGLVASIYGILYFMIGLVLGDVLYVKELINKKDLFHQSQ